MDGARACPPEDCGSTPGYERLVEFVKTGRYSYDDDGEEDLGDWLCDWDPEAFKLAKSQKAFDR